MNPIILTIAVQTDGIVTAVAALAVLGAALGLILAVASKKFHVETDPRVDQILDLLPGVNCGACGYPGCGGYAEAIVLQGAAVNLCAPGGKDCARAVAQVMGVEAGETVLNFATCSCKTKEVYSRFDYDGVMDCKAASVMGLAGAFKECQFGCLGLGSCEAACPFDAITIGEDHLPHVDEDKCTGCGKCTDACPRGLMRVDPESYYVFVTCKNKDKGAAANKVCKNSCIACKKCEKECPFDAIHVIDNLAVIDYEKCKQCGKCVGVCPKGAITNLRAERRDRKKKREAEAAAQ